MSRRTRYQEGSVQREKRRRGPDVWVFRWYETATDGKSSYRKVIVGTVTTLANEASALKAAQALRIDANQQTPLTGSGPKTISELVAHYRLKELGGSDPDGKAFSTRAGSQCYLTNWIIPHWGTHRLDQVKSVAVEEWLGSIKRAEGAKAKIRNIMSAIFSHAMRYEWVDRNPIQLVRQSAKREKAPHVLELWEIQQLLGSLSIRERTLVLLDATTGLRVSELLALKGRTSTSVIWEFGLPNRSGTRCWVSARRRPLLSLSPWTSAWRTICVDGDDSAPIQKTAAGFSQVPA